MSLRYIFIASLLGLVLLSICLLYSKQIILPEGLYVNQTRNTDGTMTFTVRTVTYNGPYGPRNAGAIWITNSSNQFVKTIKVWANNYRYTLVKWIASSSSNTTGAITSASLNSHQLHSVTWNGLTYQNAATPDGDYKINVEFTEHNATTNNPGKYKYVTFSKGPNAADISPTNESYFSTMHLVWTPVIPADGTISGSVIDAQNNPVVGATITAGTYTATSASNGSYSITANPGSYNMTCSSDGYLTANHSNVVVTSNQTTAINFIMDFVANDDHENINSVTILNQNYPNPFSNKTSLGYYLPKNTIVSMDIYNIKGEHVIRLLDAKQQAGWHYTEWNGNQVSGNKAVPGKYICKLKTDGKVLSKIVTLTK